MNKTWIVIITIVVTAVLVAGGAYYYLNNKAEDEKTELQNQIDELEDQVSDLQASGTDSDDTTITNEDPVTNQKTFTSKTHGFSIDYSDEWSVQNNLQTSGEASTNDFLKIYKDESFLRIYVEPAGWGMSYPEIEYNLNINDGKVSLSGRTENEPTGDEMTSEVAKGAIYFKMDGLSALEYNDVGYCIDAYSPELALEDDIVKMLETLEFAN